MKLMIFADDICNWDNNQEEVQIQINTRIEVAREYGLIFNEKSEVLVISRNEESPSTIIHMNNNQLKAVENFKYLGSMVSSSGRFDEEIANKNETPSKFYPVVKGLIWNKNILLKYKISSHGAVVTTLA
uniref:Reverse transcriptase domain-containing protein n=1 Tax=Cacopsylla melanoneura TaxID=428564 RepID=A0A8D9E9E0_9HEMI